MLRATISNPARSETVVRSLDREAEIETSFGGNFVDSIDGIEGSAGPGGREDWFFYVNGYWSPVGAAEARVRPGDRVWWDHRRWQIAYRVPVVVGSWPEPFAHGIDGRQLPTILDCEAGRTLCEQVGTALERAGAEVTDAPADSGEALRVLVGRLGAIADDPDAELLRGGPGQSGVYAEPGEGDRSIVALDDAGDRALEFERGSGLVAAVRRGERPATWLVTGVGRAGLRRAAEALGREALEDTYALAIGPTGERIPLPVRR